jgi:hypothetical protein
LGPDRKDEPTCEVKGKKDLAEDCHSKSSTEAASIVLQSSIGEVEGVDLKVARGLAGEEEAL